MNLAIGLIFGFLVGVLMRTPGPEYVVAANAINLSVMASLWLGISFAVGQPRSAMIFETLGASVTFVMVALVFQHTDLWLYAGFIFQSFWSALHIGDRYGVPSQRWFPGFSAMANLGFIAAFYIVRNFV